MEQFRQYEIVWVNLDPTIGSEMKKTRPCVIVSPDEMNKYLQTIIIAPITSQSKNYPTRIFLNYKEIEGWIVLDQIRTIDKRRILNKISKLNDKEATKVKSLIKEMLVD